MNLRGEDNGQWVCKREESIRQDPNEAKATLRLIKKAHLVELCNSHGSLTSTLIFLMRCIEYSEPWTCLMFLISFHLLLCLPPPFLLFH